MPSYRIHVYQNRELLQTFPSQEKITVTRRDVKQNDPAPITLLNGDAGLRLVVADNSVVSIPRNWFDVSIDKDGIISIHNRHASVSVVIGNDREIAANSSRTFFLEVLVDLRAGMVLRVEPVLDEDVEREEVGYRSLQSIPPTPGDVAYTKQLVSIRQFEGKDADTIIKLLRLALQVVQQAAGSDAFYQSAVFAAAEIVEFDRSLLLLKSDQDVAATWDPTFSRTDDWRCVAATSKQYGPQTSLNQSVSRSLLDCVLKLGTTVIHDPSMKVSPSGGDESSPSLAGVECAVASPFLTMIER